MQSALGSPPRSAKLPWWSTSGSALRDRGFTRTADARGHRHSVRAHPDATHELNRSTYVLNTPLSATDPSGYLSSGMYSASWRRWCRPTSPGTPTTPALTPPRSAWRSVRALGADLTRPDGLFLGERSFAGIVIARTSLESLMTKSKISPDGLDGSNGRIAAMCRRD